MPGHDAHLPVRRTRPRRRSTVVWVWLCLGAAATAGCSTVSNGPSTSGAAAVAYGCCGADDLADVHPGGVLSLHWTVSPGASSPSADAAPVTLSASLTGPYADAAQLKSSVGLDLPSPALTASPVLTTGQAGGAPVTTIAIPVDAAPGLYDVTTVVESAGTRLTSDHIVRVVPAAGS